MVLKRPAAGHFQPFSAGASGSVWPLLNGARVDGQGLGVGGSGAVLAASMPPPSCSAARPLAMTGRIEVRSHGQIGAYPPLAGPHRCMLGAGLGSLARPRGRALERAMRPALSCPPTARVYGSAPSPVKEIRPPRPRGRLDAQ
jgi:hypothetical protein